jgi:hypothetical protein
MSHTTSLLPPLLQELRVVVLGYIRPEMRFPGGLPQLIDRIKTDVAVGRNQLDDAENKKYMEDSFLVNGQQLS